MHSTVVHNMHTVFVLAAGQAGSTQHCWPPPSAGSRPGKTYSATLATLPIGSRPGKERSILSATLICRQQASWGAPNTFDHPFC